MLIRIPVPLEGVTRTINFTQPQLLMVVLTALAVLALHLFLTRSRLGKAMRAMADNADLAQVSGINTQLVVRVTWIIAGGARLHGGHDAGARRDLKPDLAFNIILPIFAAAIVGGLGQSYGAIAGGFLIGFAETLAVFNWTTLLRPLQGILPFELPANLALVPTEYKLTVAFVILVVVLLVAADRYLQGCLDHDAPRGHRSSLAFSSSSSSSGWCSARPTSRCCCVQARPMR